jgi:basic membrane protein A
VWLNAWFDPPRERDAAMTLFNQEADVVAFHTGSSAVMAAAQERGKMAVAYHSDMRTVAPDAQIIAVMHHWDGYYTQRAKAVLDGSWKSGNVWGGVKEGMVSVGGFGKSMPKAVQDEVLARQRDIAAGRLKPFAGPITDNEGKPVIAGKAHMTDEQILSMNFLVSGVQGTLAK